MHPNQLNGLVVFLSQNKSFERDIKNPCSASKMPYLATPLKYPTQVKKKVNLV